MNADQIKILEDILLEEQDALARYYKHFYDNQPSRRDRSTQHKQSRIDALTAAIEQVKKSSPKDEFVYNPDRGCFFKK